MANESINKVVYGNRTLIDLTGDTVESGALLQGFTAHDKSGASITGTLPTYETMTQAEATAGTSTSGKLISAKVLNDTITGYGYATIQIVRW